MGGPHSAVSAWRSRGDRRKEGLYLQLIILNKGIGLVSPQEWIKVRQRWIGK